MACKGNLTCSKELELLFLFYLYHRVGEHGLYINHMEGFKLLQRWLAPAPYTGPQRARYPWWIGNYETQRLSILTGYPEIFIVSNMARLARKFSIDKCPNF